MRNFPLIHLGPVPLAFLCHNCMLEVDEGFCPMCGAKLTARDLTTKSAPAAHMAASTAEASTKGA